MTCVPKVAVAAPAFFIVAGFMKYIEIPNTELSVSRMAYGSWHLGGEWNKSRPLPDVNQRAVQLVKTAVDCGINHIDLADIYSMGKSDQVVGHALRQNKGLRNKLVLQEKCGIVLARDPDFGPPQRYDLRYKTHYCVRGN